MGGGMGMGLDFGNTWGSGRLPLRTELPDTIPGEDWQIGRSLGAAAMNYDVRDPRSGRAYRFIEGTTISHVEVFAGKGTRNKLNPKVAHGLSEQVGGRPRDWQHAKGIGTLEYHGHARRAEVHWFQANGVGRVKFKVKEWLD
jgi:hypothetical protein